MLKSLCSSSPASILTFTMRLYPRRTKEEATLGSPYTDRTLTSRSTFSAVKDDVEAALLEYVGTTIFLLLAFGGVQASASEARASVTYSEIERALVISLSFGLSLLVSVWLFYRVTGGLFNPEVSLALLITGVIGPLRFGLYCIAQLLGGITAAGIVLALTPGPLASK